MSILAELKSKFWLDWEMCRNNALFVLPILMSHLCSFKRTWRFRDVSPMYIYIYIYIYIYNVMEVLMVYRLSSLEMDTVIQVQIHDEAVCISHCSNTLGKIMHPTILSLQLWINSRADWALLPWYDSQSNRMKSNFKPVNSTEKIDLVSHPAYADGLLNTLIYIDIYTHIYIHTYTCTHSYIYIYIYILLDLSLIVRNINYIPTSTNLGPTGFANT